MKKQRIVSIGRSSIFGISAGFGLCLLSLSKAFALDPARTLDQYACRPWTRATDGVDFKVMGAGRNSGSDLAIVYSIAPSQDAGIWFGLHEDGFGYYHPITGWSIDNETFEGVVMIDPSDIRTNHIPPPVYVTQVIANDTVLSPVENLSIPPGRGNLQFDYTATSFITPSHIQFRYRLEGYDEDWIEAGSRRQAFYTNLKPRKYRFTVIAANADGVWNEIGDSLDVDMLPHFYQTLWFYLVCGMASTGVLAGAGIHTAGQRRRARLLLEAQVKERTAELAEAKGSLKNEIEERKRMELEVERVNRQLVDASRQAGMAEIATGVIHNVGNVLNSVNVSATIISDKIKRSKVSGLKRLSSVFQEHEQDLEAFLSKDPKGRQIPSYVDQLARHLGDEQAALMDELKQLKHNIAHVADIVAIQQNYASIAGTEEVVLVTELVEDSLRLNASALVRHDITVTCNFQDVPKIRTERHKILQILVNLIRNAKYACDESGSSEKIITIEIHRENGHLCIHVQDNGVGISSENLTRIFSHGFTTRPNGHGFGLHSSALAAKQMGGSISVHSEGPGTGARFTLKLPCDSP